MNTTPVRAADLERKHGFAGDLRFEDTLGGLVRAVISTPEADGAVYLHGAHVTDWTPRGQRPVLFLSSKSLFVPGKAIRGGIPVIFPWFGDRSDRQPGPAHGFARTLEWELESTEPRGGARAISLVLLPNDVTRGLGYDDFHLRLRVSFRSALEIKLEARNDSNQPLHFEEALHSYFSIGDIDQVSVSGLEGTTYIDKTDGFKRKQQADEPLRIHQETDQVHLNTTASCIIHDPVWQRRITIKKSGSNSTVVWNPWIEKTKGISDLAPDDWKHLICVETANATDNALQLLPGASHTLRMAIRVE